MTARVPNQQRAIDTRDRILCVTDRLIVSLVFGGEGLGKLKMSDVLREADVSPGTMYDYFPDRQALIDGLIDRYILQIETVVAETLAITEAVNSALDVTENLFVAIANFFEANPGRRALSRSGAIHAERRSVDRAREQQRLAAIVDLFQHQGFLLTDSATAIKHLNLTWRMAEALMRETFELALDSGDHTTPRDSEIVAEVHKIVRDHLNSSGLYTPPGAAVDTPSS